MLDAFVLSGLRPSPVSRSPEKEKKRVRVREKGKIAAESRDLAFSRELSQDITWGYKQDTRGHKSVATAIPLKVRREMSGLRAKSIAKFDSLVLES